MARVSSGQSDPERVLNKARQAAVEAKRQTHRGKRVSQLSPSEQADLLEAIAMMLGLADNNGAVV